MTKEEIKDMLDVNSTEDMVEYIYKLEQDFYKNKRALETARVVIRGSVTKSRYNNILQKYLSLIKKN